MIFKHTLAALAMFCVATSAWGGLIGHWDFEAGVTDVGPNNLGGTTVGTATIVTDGTRGEVLSLSNSQNSYVNVLHSDVLNLTDEVTVAAWVYAINGGPDAVLSKGQWTQAYGVRLDDQAAQRNVINFAGRNRPGTSSTGAVSPGEWVYIAVTFDVNTAGDDTAFYIGGSLDSTKERGSSLTTNTTDLRIGYANQNWSRWNGMIDDVAVWDQVLTKQQINNAMNLGAGNFLGSSLTWGGGPGNWATAGKWDPSEVPTGSSQVTVDKADAEISITANADALSLDVKQGIVTVQPTFILDVGNSVNVDAAAALIVDGTLNAATGSVAGTLAGTGIIDILSIDVSGSVAPGGDGAAGALTVAAGSELVFEDGTYNAEVILSDLTNLTADEIVNSKVGNDEGTLIITGGTLAPKGVGRSDSGSFSPITSLPVVDNTQGGVLEGKVEDGFHKFGAVVPDPKNDTISHHIGQGAFLRDVIYDPGVPTPAVKIDVVVALEGDVDGDGLIGLDDWDTFRSNFGSSETDWTQGNFDSWSDDTVDLDDWDRFRNRFGQTYPIDGAASAAAAVPEPGTIVMLLGALAGLGLIVRRRR